MTRDSATIAMALEEGIFPNRHLDCLCLGTLLFAFIYRGDDR
jgi:hypothetical protein